MYNNGFTALSREGHLEIVRELCERGANVNTARTDNGMTDVGESLWPPGDSVRELCAAVNAAMMNNVFIALMSASREGHLEIVRELC